MNNDALFEAYFSTFKGSKGGSQSKTVSVVSVKTYEENPTTGVLQSSGVRKGAYAVVTFDNEPAPKKGDILAVYNGVRQNFFVVDSVDQTKKTDDTKAPVSELIPGFTGKSLTVSRASPSPAGGIFTKKLKTLKEDFERFAGSLEEAAEQIHICVPDFLVEEFEAIVLEESKILAEPPSVSDLVFEGNMEAAVDSIFERLSMKFFDTLNESLETTTQDTQTQLNEDRFALDLNEGEDEADIEEATRLAESLEARSRGVLFENLEDDLEAAAVSEIIGAGRSLGGTFDSVGYSEGLLMIDLHNKSAVQQFADWLEDREDVYAYDIEAGHLNQDNGAMETHDIDLSSIVNDQGWTFSFSIYLNPSIVQYDGYEVDVDEDFEIGPLDEVVRKIKINAKGKKRIKMKCQRGFKWDTEKRACVKIGGSEIAKMRKRLRRAVLTKRSKGAAFKTRVLRKTRKAKRFRRMMGLSS